MMPLLLALATLAIPTSLVAEPVLLDRVVAVFDSGVERGKRTIVTLSDLELEARLALVNRGGASAGDGELAPELLATSLDWLIAELLLLEEAQQLDLDEVDPEELRLEVAKIAERFGSEASFLGFLHRHEIAERDLARTARRRLVVGRYLESRIRLVGGVSDRDVEVAWAEMRDELGGMSLEDAAVPLRAQLEKEQREQVVSRLVEDLRARAGVRILHRFDQR